MIRQWRSLGLLGLTAVLFGAFQNCGKVRLADVKEDSFASTSSALKADGDLCLPVDETLESFFVSNLNSIIVNGKMQMDSDADGLSDAEEELLGSNPLLRRSSKGILDSICQKADYNIRCESINVTCNNLMNHFGLSDCDIQALQLDQLYGHPTQGVDSDKDGIPDLLEIRAGTFPNISDATEDPDHDGRENQIEIAIGSDPRVADGQFPSEYQVLVQKTKLPPSLGCNGEHWQVKVQQIPMVRTMAFDGGLEPELSHGENENIIMLVLKTRPKVGVLNKNAKVRALYQRISVPIGQQGQGLNPDFSFSLPQFNFVGEVEP